MTWNEKGGNEEPGTEVWERVHSLFKIAANENE